MSDGWILTTLAMPPAGTVVMTKVDDEYGCRLVQPLKRRATGCVGVTDLWFVPDGATYVPHQPTHWKPVFPKESNPRIGIDATRRQKEQRMYLIIAEMAKLEASGELDRICPEWYGELLLHMTWLIENGKA